MKVRHKLMLLVSVPLVCQIAFSGLVLFDLKQMQAALHQIAQSSPQLNSMMAAFEKFCTNVAWLLIVGLVASALTSVIATVYFFKRFQGRLEQARQKLDALPKREALAGDVNGDEIDQLIAEIGRVQAVPSVLTTSQVFSVRSMSRKVPDVICAMNENFDIVSVNPACQTQWDYRQEELVGRKISGIISADTLEATVSTLRQCKENGGTVNFENEIICGSGRVAETRWSVNWSKHDQLYCSVVHDVSEIKALARMKKEFVQMISHDLRTPLTSVNMILTMLGQGFYGKLEPKAEEVVARSSNNIARVINLINELLDLERMEEGKLELHLRKTPVSEVIDRSLNAVEGFARLHRVKLEREISELFVEGDPDRLVQVVINLLSNGIKYSGEGTTVTVRAKLENQEAFVEVSDQGPGIPKEQQSELFTRFKQLDPAPNSRVASSGLGLAICKVIIEAHKGEIGVASEVGKGSRFWFSVPCAN
jgi:PAS domain S-box-containing protein